MLEDVRSSCEDIGKGVPWLVGGQSVEQFRELVSAKKLAPPEKQGPIAAGMQRRKLLALLEEGKGGRDGVYQWYEV